MKQGQAGVVLEAAQLKVVVLKELGDALAGLGAEVVTFVALGLDQERAPLVRMHGEQVDVVVLKALVAAVTELASQQRQDVGLGCRR